MRPTTPFLGEVLASASEVASTERRLGEKTLDTPFLTELTFGATASEGVNGNETATQGADTFEAAAYADPETVAAPLDEVTRADFASLGELEQLALDELLNESDGQEAASDEATGEPESWIYGAEAGISESALGFTTADTSNDDGRLALPPGELDLSREHASQMSGYLAAGGDESSELLLEQDEADSLFAGAHFSRELFELESSGSLAIETESGAESDDTEFREPELPEAELLEPEWPVAESESDFAEFESTAAALKLIVVDESDQPVTEGQYAAHQGGSSERGEFSKTGKGIAQFKSIDPSKPFIFEVRDRACAIARGAYIDPDDASIQYGGTWFDWTLVRDDKNAEQAFWRPYLSEMAAAAKALRGNVVLDGVDKFWQHEHITRRPITLTQSARKGAVPIKIQAIPIQIRTGPIVRYTDSQRAVIWLELVTPALVRVLAKRGGSPEPEKNAYAASVRVGGRHFVAVELAGLEPNALYAYTVELAPPPATGPIPVEPQDLQASFPALTSGARRILKQQLAGASLSNREWLSFRTLRPKYDKLRFATGSCRFYPGDTHKSDTLKDGDIGPDMLRKLGDWAIQTSRDQWPHFLFFGGDQIYSDEMGDDHHTALVRGRFSSRVPGPADPNSSVASKLIDGAWAGRFAHRYVQRKPVTPTFHQAITKGLTRLDQYYSQNRALKLIRDWQLTESQLIEQHTTLKNRRQLNGAKQEAGDEKALRVALALLPEARKLEVGIEPYRTFVRYWDLANIKSVQNPQAFKYRSVNFLLWRLPNFESHIPTLEDQSGVDKGVRRPGGAGHPSADGGKHAADFAEYGFLYERAWFVHRPVRVLLGNIPTFLMFDDHDVTDDWNFDAGWVRMVHSTRDHYRMWPKTITDALCAYWVYQAWGNKAPSQWKGDRRAEILAQAQRNGTDALPELRKCIYNACVAAVPQDSQAAFQTGLSLDWHYQIPIDPPFLVPDCRSRKRFVPTDDVIREIDHGKTPPQSETIDAAQMKWMRDILQSYKGTAAIIAPSTPLLMQLQVMNIMMKPEAFAKGWAGDLDVAAVLALVFDSTKLGIATNELLRTFRREKDLEHMIRDKSWRDFWSLVQGLQRSSSPLKTLMLVSGDVHHSYCMTANLSGNGRPRPELLQVTCSGLQTNIRDGKEKAFAGWKSSIAADVGGHRLVPGYVMHAGSQKRIVAIYENAVALVDMSISAEVGVNTTYFTGYKKDGAYRYDKYVFRYTSGAEYLKNGEPAIQTAWR